MLCGDEDLAAITTGSARPWSPDGWALPSPTSLTPAHGPEAAALSLSHVGFQQSGAS